MRWRWPPDSFDGIPVCEARELDEIEQLVDALADLLLGPLPDREREGDVVADRHVLERRVVLEDEADVAPLRRESGRVLAREQDLAGVGALEAGDDAQQGRLPRSARAEHGRERAVGDLERDVVEGGEGAEALGDAANLDRHQRTPLSAW